MRRFTRIAAASVFGARAERVDVQVSIAGDDEGGEAGTFRIVGLPDSALREGRERVRSAVRHGGWHWPHAPAGLVDDETADHAGPGVRRLDAGPLCSASHQTADAESGPMVTCHGLVITSRETLAECGDGRASSGRAFRMDFTNAEPADFRFPSPDLAKSEVSDTWVPMAAPAGEVSGELPTLGMVPLKLSVEQLTGEAIDVWL